MNELIGPLGLPGALAALVAVAYGSVSLWEKLHRKPEPNGNGDWRANTAAAMTALTSATAHLTQAVRDIGADISDVKTRSSTLDVRLGAIATREDLHLVAEKNRHANRTELQVLLGELDDLKTLLQNHDAWERGRAGAQGGAI
jgi:hypothetical protein